MIISLLAAALLMPPVPRDTTIRFGIVTRDLTGDTIPEVITLTGEGQSIADLAMTFTIRSSGRTLYTRTWRLARANYDGGGTPNIGVLVLGPKTSLAQDCGRMALADLH